MLRDLLDAAERRYEELDRTKPPATCRPWLPGHTGKDKDRGVRGSSAIPGDIASTATPSKPRRSKRQTRYVLYVLCSQVSPRTAFASLTAEKHDGAARAVEGQCVSAARTRTDVLYLSPVYAIETPAITELSDKGPTTEQHNRAGSGCHGRARARGRSERRYLNPARAIPRPGRNALTIEQEHSGAYAVKGHWTGSRRSGVCLLSPILAVELPGIRDGRRLVCPEASK
jgi:hypothetical protein